MAVKKNSAVVQNPMSCVSKAPRIGVGRICASTVIVFFATMALCVVLITLSVLNRNNAERVMMGQLVIEKSDQLSDSLTKLLHKTHTLCALTLRSDGEVSDFSNVAAALMDDPAISNVYMAPDGGAAYVFPPDAVTEYTEQMLDEISDARQTNQLAMGGPYVLDGGGQALMGWLPVYLNDDTGNKPLYWGISGITLKFPEALHGAALPALETQGFAFELYSANPNSASEPSRTLIAASEYPYNKRAMFAERQIRILNAEWYIRVSPVRCWYEYLETWLSLFVSLMASLIVAHMAQNNAELKALKVDLEAQARVDSLTGVLNRRCFMEMSNVAYIKSIRNKRPCCVIMVDLDLFKHVNDTYGHLAGDETLRTVAKKLASQIRPYDLLARFGGEEFILLFCDVDLELAAVLAERLRAAVADTDIHYKNFCIKVTASFGVALAAPENELEEAIDMADMALYLAKRAGRNRVSLYNKEELPPNEQRALNQKTTQ